MTYEDMPLTLVDKSDPKTLHISWRDPTWCKEDTNGLLEKSLGNHILGFYESHINLQNQRAHMKIAKT